MADLKISALPASSTPLAGTEVLPIVQSATTRQVSVANLTAGRAVSALSLTSTNDATLSGLTVGRGGGADATNTAVGSGALAATNTGGGNTGVGVNALNVNISGNSNTSVGMATLRSNLSGAANTANGYLALADNISGNYNTAVGYSALSAGTANSNNTGIGHEALKVTSGSTNTAIGYQSGIAMTTGTKNVILGSYSGNTGTLDIRINNNNIVLSDGDGNVRAWWDNANARFFGPLTVTGLTNSALTSGRVTYAGTAGLLQDSAGLTYDGTNLTTTGTATATRFIPSGSTVATNGMYLPAANTLAFSTNSAERIRITSAGDLILGATSNYNNRLFVKGSGTSTYVSTNWQGQNVNSVRLESGGTPANGDTVGISISIGGNAEAYIGVVQNASSFGDIVFQSYNGAYAEKMRIDSNGIVTMHAYGAGAATFSAAGVISSVSDETWKRKDGVPTNTDAMLQKLEPGYWFYNEEKAPTFGEERQLGFYAQNVHEAIGEEAAPTPEEGKPWGYYDRSVLAITVMSLKNALNTIEELKQRVIALENK